MAGRPSPTTVSTKLERIAELAKEDPERALTTLAHHIDIEWLHEAYRRTRKGGAKGVDGRTAADFAANLEDNLQSLLNRFKSGTYRAPPVRRVHIPKGDGKKTRPIGIPTFEDKVLQRAVAMVLEAVYEQDFLDCSYGFRPGRSAHQALEAVRKGLMSMGGGLVLEVDIQAFYDDLDHAHLRSFLDRRVRDGVLRRMIDKWLKAGVLEEGVVHHPETGSPQGGVISPILSNVYLHEVLDRWFDEEVKPRLGGRAFLVRYADDVAIVLSSERDTERVMAVLPKRVGRFGLTLHPVKTRVVPFRRPRGGGDNDDRGNGGPRPGTFDLLGFTHFWGKSRRGRWVVKKKTAASRMVRAVKRVSEWCRRARHRPLREQHKVLSSKLRGHYNYYGVTGNSWSLERFRYEAVRLWWKWLGRRSQRARLTERRRKRLKQLFPLPSVVVVHSIYRRVAKP